MTGPVGLPLPLFLILAFLMLAGTAFTYGCAKHEGYGKLADVAAVVSAAAWGVNVLFWEVNQLAVPAAIVSTTAGVALVVMATRQRAS